MRTLPRIIQTTNYRCRDLSDIHCICAYVNIGGVCCTCNALFFLLMQLKWILMLNDLFSCIHGRNYSAISSSFSRLITQLFLRLEIHPITLFTFYQPFRAFLRVDSRVSTAHYRSTLKPNSFSDTRFYPPKNSDPPNKSNSDPNSELPD